MKYNVEFLEKFRGSKNINLKKYPQVGKYTYTITEVDIEERNVNILKITVLLKDETSEYTYTISYYENSKRYDEFINDLDTAYKYDKKLYNLIFPDENSINTDALIGTSGALTIVYNAPYYNVGKLIPNGSVSKL